MGFLTADSLRVDVQTWRGWSRLRQLRESVVFWGEHGSGVPRVILLAYVVKMLLFGGLAILITAVSTPSLGGLGAFGEWWAEPIFFEKTVVWAVLFEILGFGCSSGPLTQRTRPLIGGLLYWLRPGTLRLPPWPRWLPGTAGDTRAPLDVTLYALVLAAAVLALVLPGGLDQGMHYLPPWAIAPLAVFLGVLGLRDRVPFLAARAEHYWMLLLVLLFPVPEQIAGAQVLTAIVWFGAVLSKMNRHFPSVVAVMMSNSPIHPWKKFRRELFRDYPNDMRPSKIAAAHARVGSLVELAAPLVLLFSNGTVTIIAVAVIVIFHLHIVGMFPMGIPSEWNLMMMFSAIALFGGHADLAPWDIHSPLLIAVLAVSLGIVLLGNFWPAKISFLFAMRYYAGNWAATFWCFRGEADERMESNITKVSASVRNQLIERYGAERIDIIAGKQGVFRSMHLHGRALNGLLPRALDEPDEYRIQEGEVTAGPLLGWNFGDGHLHNEQLLNAVQKRCHYAPGELRVIVLESQPIHRQWHRYRIVDAATGLVEQGRVLVRDMAARQPWLDEQDPTIPVHPDSG